MKLHIGVDSKENMIYSVATTLANVHDSQRLLALLHGNERRIYGDLLTLTRNKRSGRLRLMPKVLPISELIAMHRFQYGKRQKTDENPQFAHWAKHRF